MIHALPEGAVRPTRTYHCIRCGSRHTIVGTWNPETGRWLMAFNCRDCEEHQEAFVSEPLHRKKLLLQKQRDKEADYASFEGDNLNL